MSQKHFRFFYAKPKLKTNGYISFPKTTILSFSKACSIYMYIYISAGNQYLLEEKSDKVFEKYC